VVIDDQHSLCHFGPTRNRDGVPVWAPVSYAGWLVDSWQLNATIGRGSHYGGWAARPA
jgi:hypothetical protein